MNYCNTWRSVQRWLIRLIRCAWCVHRLHVDMATVPPALPFGEQTVKYLSKFFLRNARTIASSRGPRVFFFVLRLWAAPPKAYPCDFVTECDLFRRVFSFCLTVVRDLTIHSNLHQECVQCIVIDIDSRHTCIAYYTICIYLVLVGYEYLYLSSWMKNVLTKCHSRTSVLWPVW